MLSDRCMSCLFVCPACLSCLSVTLAYCGQTVGWIKMKLGKQVGLGPGHIVIDGDIARLPQKGSEPPNFRSISVVPKWLSWMDRDATWYGGRPWPKRLCVRWGSSSSQSPIFRSFLLWPNGWMHPDAIGYGGRPQPRRLC